MNNKLEKITEYLLYIFVFLIPWQTRYIYNQVKLGSGVGEYGKLSFYVSELVLFLLIFFCLFYFKPRVGPKLKNKNLFIFKIIFLFLVVVLISGLGALSSKLYFYGLIKLIEVIVVYILIFRINFSYIKLARSFIFSMLIHSGLAIYQFFSQSIGANKYLGIAEQISAQGGVSVLEGSFGRLLRAYGGLSHPNILGGFLVIAILFLISIYLFPVKSEFSFNKVKKKKKSIWFYFSLVILFSALILSFSRSAYLALGISLLFLFIYSIFKKIAVKKIISILIFLILVSSISFVLFNDFIQTRIQGINRLEIKSNMEREVLQNQARVLLPDNWFLGTGLNNYLINVYSRINSNLNIWEYQPVHNVYLLIWIELGILGLGLYLFFIFYSLYQVFKLGGIKKFILGLVLLSILIINFWDHYFYTYWSGLIISFLIIALINKKEKIKNIF
jgi:O-antigen ligase